MNKPPDVPENTDSYRHNVGIKHRMSTFALENPKEARAIQKYLHKASHLIKRLISLEGRDHSLLDTKILYLKIVQIFNEINKLCKKIAKTERQAVLEQQLEAANKIREVGKEQMMAHLTRSSFAIASSIASMAESAIVSKKASANDEAFKEHAASTVDKNGKLFFLSEEVAKAAQKFASKEMALYKKPASAVVEGTADILKAVGELGSGIKQLDIAKTESNGFNVYAKRVQLAIENPEDTKAIKFHLRNANRLITKFVSLGEGNHELLDIQIIYLKIMRIFDEIRKLFSQKTH